MSSAASKAWDPNTFEPSTRVSPAGRTQKIERDDNGMFGTGFMALVDRDRILGDLGNTGVAAALIGFAVLGAAKPNALGTAIGALFVGILLQGLTMMNAPYYTQDFVTGGVLVIALVFTFALTSRSRQGGH